MYQFVYFSFQLIWMKFTVWIVCKKFLNSSPLPSVVYPGPWGHIFLYCAVPGSGQSSHWWPQPRPPSQQHSDLVTRLRLLDAIWHMVCSTSAKQSPCRLSGRTAESTGVNVMELTDFIISNFKLHRTIGTFTLAITFNNVNILLYGQSHCLRQFNNYSVLLEKFIECSIPIDSLLNLTKSDTNSLQIDF